MFDSKIEQIFHFLAYLHTAFYNIFCVFFGHKPMGEILIMLKILFFYRGNYLDMMNVEIYHMDGS